MSFELLRDYLANMLDSNVSHKKLQTNKLQFYFCYWKTKLTT